MENRIEIMTVTLENVNTGSHQAFQFDDDQEGKDWGAQFETNHRYKVMYHGLSKE